MSDFLDTVVAERRADARAAGPLDAIGRGDVPVRSGAARPSLADVIRAKRAAGHVAVIAEVKRRSPASGDLAPNGDPAAIASVYAAAGAAAISVLTEPRHWGGSVDDLVSVARAVDLPILYKDVVVDERQLREAAAAGASAVLLIAEALGVKIDLGPDAVATCVGEVGVGFMFAPRFHPAMRHAAGVRSEIGIRTIFNVLGPLANPAGVTRQLLGVPSAVLGGAMVQVLRELGAEHALVVHSADGLDEISPSGPTRTWELRDGEISEGELTPEDLGLTVAPRASLRGGDKATNAGIARAVLSGAAGDGARTAVLLNAGAACYVAGLAPDIRGGVALSAAAIGSGAAHATLERWVARSATLA